ncbi:hypothetical protein DQ04_21241000 [Trypanosoma grayi]|uniref:hypothetical protein n=1 Tax=Trypanosoma grayi TaxID=71804 RepID=UPI0004F44D0C|nr:hypothetical protein DQ04_21241000 [Trypanosoma grayi]KEG05501.1 hypothetical protein DQ04_21241000 [Trypanosoma grayi]
MGNATLVVADAAAVVHGAGNATQEAREVPIAMAEARQREDEEAARKAAELVRESADRSTEAVTEAKDAAKDAQEAAAAATSAADNAAKVATELQTAANDLNTEIARTAETLNGSQRVNGAGDDIANKQKELEAKALEAKKNAEAVENRSKRALEKARKARTTVVEAQAKAGEAGRLSSWSSSSTKEYVKKISTAASKATVAANDANVAAEKAEEIATKALESAKNAREAATAAYMATQAVKQVVTFDKVKIEDNAEGVPLNGDDTSDITAYIALKLKTTAEFANKAQENKTYMKKTAAVLHEYAGDAVKAVEYAREGVDDAENSVDSERVLAEQDWKQLSQGAARSGKNGRALMRNAADASDSPAWVRGVPLLLLLSALALLAAC